MTKKVGKMIEFRVILLADITKKSVWKKYLSSWWQSLWRIYYLLKLKIIKLQLTIS